MINYTHNEEKQVGNTTYIWFIGTCISTDIKPLNLIYDQSELRETDTLKKFIYSASKNQWQEIGSGSTPSESNGGVLFVSTDMASIITNSVDPNDPPILDKTYAEIKEASRNGVVVLKWHTTVDDYSSMPDVPPDYEQDLMLSLTGVGCSNGSYYVTFYPNPTAQNSLLFFTDSENGYPVYGGGAHVDDNNGGEDAPPK